MKARFPIAIALMLLPVRALSNEHGSMPAWLAGQWQMEDGANWAEEQWMAPRGGAMLGMAREGFGPDVNGWETMRIATKPGGKLTLFAQPKGAPATEFAMVTASDDAIEFSNAANDYPQRIRYWRQGQWLLAEISKLDGSNAKQWRYRPVAMQ